MALPASNTIKLLGSMDSWDMAKVFFMFFQPKGTELIVHSKFRPAVVFIN